ncbi:type II toxin-antitoxin system VapC family toxin [soil metagenome]
MLAVDTNVLVYAHRREAREHAAARALVTQLAEGRRPWAIPWPCVYEFFGVVTHPRIWKDAASTAEQAWTQLGVWQASPTLELIGEPRGFFEVLGEFLARPRVRGPIVHDARIAALCAAHGIETLLTRDRDFSLFPELHTEDPF